MTKPVIVADNLEVPGAGPEPWMLDPAKMLFLKELPTGVIVGSASIAKCEEGEDRRSRIQDRAKSSKQYSILYPPASMFAGI